jgi:hypothetical protein
MDHQLTHRSGRRVIRQVVPDFGGVLMMMSPGRAERRCQRMLSITADHYRTGASPATHS